MTVLTSAMDLPPEIAMDETSPPDTSDPTRDRLRRFVLAALITVLFGILLAGGVALLVARLWFASFAVIAVALMAIPLCDLDAPLGERLRGSLTMLAAFCGLALAIVGYFLMFYFDWFRAIFNGKSIGPMGLMFSALCGFAAGGLLGFRCMRRFFPTEGPAAAPATPDEDKCPASSPVNSPSG